MIKAMNFDHWKFFIPFSKRYFMDMVSIQNALRPLPKAVFHPSFSSLYSLKYISRTIQKRNIGARNHHIEGSWIIDFAMSPNPVPMLAIICAKVISYFYLGYYLNVFGFLDVCC